MPVLSTAHSLLSRHSRRTRIGSFGWMATALLSGGFPHGTRARSAPSGRDLHDGREPYRALKELTRRVKLSQYGRGPRPNPHDHLSQYVSSAETQTNTGNSDFEARRLQSELAIEICQTYSKLPPMKLPISLECERMKILLMLASECSTSDDNILKAVITYNDRIQLGLSSTTRQATTQLRNACTPVYEEVLEYILRCDARSAIPFLVKLREDTLRALQFLRSLPQNDERLHYLEDLDAYLLRVFELWFSPSMLEFRRITYDGTPASIIEFIATKEAVHPMKSLDDLRSRLGAGRRVLSLFHPMLDNQPLLFVHAALTDHIPSSMSEVMDRFPQERPSCATFYSITNAQPGLAGIGLGEHLLKESIAFLQKEFPSLDTFVTLSPMPQFRTWLAEKIRKNEENGAFFDDTIMLKEDWNKLVNVGLMSAEDPSWKSFLTCLEGMDFDSRTGNEELLAVLEPILTRLATRYVYLEKHRGKPFDKVARFHLGNGAMVHRINFGADLSRKGIHNSFGMMVNYLYDLKMVDENRRNYEQTYQIQASSDILKLVAMEDRSPSLSKL